MPGVGHNVTGPDLESSWTSSTRPGRLLLKIFDHLATTGSGAGRGQRACVDQVLNEIGKSGISHAGGWLDKFRGSY